MNVNTLIAALFPGFHIDEMVMLDQNILVKAHTTSRVTICPNCHQPSERVHMERKEKIGLLSLKLEEISLMKKLF
jgi:hypothetical protein